MDETFKHPQPPPFDAEEASDLTRAILSRTSGSPCQRLQSQACAFVDGELGQSQESLVRAHLEHCATCSALVQALVETKVVLPTLARVNPGPWFTQRILRVTLHAPRPSFTARFDGRALWLKLMHRPRIALETAYLGAAAGLMGLYLPLPTLPSALRVPAMVQSFRAPAQRVVGPIVQAEQRTAVAFQKAILPRETLGVPMLRAGSLWQRLMSRLRSGGHWAWEVLRPSARAPEKSSKSPNP